MRHDLGRAGEVVLRDMDRQEFDAYVAADQRLLIAEVDGERVGHVWLARQPERGATYIYDLEVVPEFRGKGYGRRLMQMIEDEANAMGTDRVMLNVYADNAVARSLYDSLGYGEMQRQLVKDLT